MLNHKILQMLLPALTLLATNVMASDSFDNRSKLSLTAHSTLSVPADELQLSIGVVTLSDTAEAALAENSSKMQAIIATIEAAGLPKSDYKTSRFSIHPNYTPYPKDPPQNWKPSIVGYEVSNAINIKTDKLDLAGKLIDTASKAGANNIENISFGLKDQRSHWDQSITQATTNAKNDAEVIARAANIKLVKLLEVSLENTNLIAPQQSDMRFTKFMAAEATPPIKAEDIEINSSVNVVYEIAPNL
ncbi:MAG: SIMPL domain-containing protein [Parachlamydiaceae bacterium]|nr:SIMPL domain-containing protein [Parachlamydiaceae bacterium]